MGNRTAKRRVVAKRYQYWGPNGLQWSNWFPFTGSEEKWQLKSSKTRNEYKYSNN